MPIVIEALKSRVTTKAIANVKARSEKYHVAVFSNDFLMESPEWWE